MSARAKCTRAAMLRAHPRMKHDDAKNLSPAARSLQCGDIFWHTFITYRISHQTDVLNDQMIWYDWIRTCDWVCTQHSASAHVSNVRVIFLLILWAAIIFLCFLSFPRNRLYRSTQTHRHTQLLLSDCAARSVRPIHKYAILMFEKKSVCADRGTRFSRCRNRLRLLRAMRCATTR